MKLKTRQKAIKSEYEYVIPVGCCFMRNLLHYRNPIAYTIRLESWAADIYEYNSIVAISTGYEPFGTMKLTTEQYMIIKQYEEQARKINTNYDLEYNVRKQQVENLLTACIMDLLDMNQ